MAKVKLLETKESHKLYKELLDGLNTSEVALVKNLDYIHAPYDLYPLAKKRTGALDCIKAMAMDMDGTSTTTEPLALHSLEYMVRKFTGRMEKSEWEGLDEVKDHPYIIGSSNFRHTEFLIERYKDKIDRESFKVAFFEAIFWTLASSQDEQRRKDVIQNAINSGLGKLFDDKDFKETINHKTIDDDTMAEVIAPFLEKYGPSFKCDTFGKEVSAALDIYYTRYHYILNEIDKGRGEQLARQFVEPGKELIGPMPGFGIFIALIKGWLGDEADKLYNLLKKMWLEESPNVEAKVAEDEIKPNSGQLNKLSSYFEKNPVKVALVTASIYYEAHTVMKEIFNVLQRKVDSWPISDERKEFLKEKFSSYRNVFDAFVTASDASEARLKPHRDLYSISLYQMAIHKEDYPNCIVLEDTSPGIIAARGAGYGMSVAMPNRDTKRQDYVAASRVIFGGLPEVILKYHLFLKLKKKGKVNNGR